MSEVDVKKSDEKENLSDEIEEINTEEEINVGEDEKKKEDVPYDYDGKYKLREKAFQLKQLTILVEKCSKRVKEIVSKLKSKGQENDENSIETIRLNSTAKAFETKIYYYKESIKKVLEDMKTLNSTNPETEETYNEEFSEDVSQVLKVADKIIKDTHNFLSTKVRKFFMKAKLFFGEAARNERQTQRETRKADKKEKRQNEKKSKEDAKAQKKETKEKLKAQEDGEFEDKYKIDEIREAVQSLFTKGDKEEITGISLESVEPSKVRGEIKNSLNELKKNRNLLIAYLAYSRKTAEKNINIKSFKESLENKHSESFFESTKNKFAALLEHANGIKESSLESFLGISENKEEILKSSPQEDNVQEKKKDIKSKIKEITAQIRSLTNCKENLDLRSNDNLKRDPVIIWCSKGLKGDQKNVSQSEDGKDIFVLREELEVGAKIINSVNIKLRGKMRDIRNSIVEIEKASTDAIKAQEKLAASEQKVKKTSTSYSQLAPDKESKNLTSFKGTGVKPTKEITIDK